MGAGKLVLSYVLTFAAFIAIDMIWLGVIARNLYKNQIGSLMASQVNWVAAIIFYLLYVVAILVFAVFPAIEQGSLLRAILLGAFFGIVAYATYDLTNLATLKDWPVTLVFIDIAWGAVLTGTVSAAGYAIVQFLK